jgi:hypothetical protein
MRRFTHQHHVALLLWRSPLIAHHTLEVVHKLADGALIMLVHGEAVRADHVIDEVGTR